MFDSCQPHHKNAACPVSGHSQYFVSATVVLRAPPILVVLDV